MITCINTCTHTYTHTHIHTYTHAHMHTCTTHISVGLEAHNNVGMRQISCGSQEGEGGRYMDLGLRYVSDDSVEAQM